MKINTTNYINNDHVVDRSFKGIPDKTLFLPEGAGKAAQLAGSYINTPEQKLFLATTALMFTPLIDLKYARDDKQTDSAIKSASKAIAGGLTGVTIRAVCNSFFTKNIGFGEEKLNPYFFPKSALKTKDLSVAMGDLRLNQYCKTMGTLAAVLIMILYTNKNVDVPLTSDIQDLLSGVVKENKSWLQSLYDVSKNRKEKIQNWLTSKKNKIIDIKNKIRQINEIIKGEKPSDTNNDTGGKTS